MMASIQLFVCGPSSTVWSREDAIFLNRGRSGEGIGMRTASLYRALLRSRVIASIVANSVREPCKVTLSKVLWVPVASFPLIEPIFIARVLTSAILITLNCWLPGVPNRPIFLY